MKEGVVFAIADRSNAVRYIGFTTQDLEKRLMQMQDSNDNEPVLQWLRNSEGGERIFSVWQCAARRSRDWLRTFVAYYLAQGCNLLNDRLRPKFKRNGCPISSVPVFIYTLSHPQTGDIRYVGKTIDLKDRQKGHKRLGKTRCDCWKKSLIARGLWPDFNVIETVPIGENWKDREAYWIQFYRDTGCELTNLSTGGEGGAGVTHSEETRAKMRALFLGRPIPPEQRAQISASLTGKKQSPETVTKRQATINANRAAKGLDPRNFGNDEEIRLRQLREAYDRKARAAGRPIRYSPEWVEKRRASFMRTVATLSPEQRAARAAHLNEKPIRYWQGKKRGPMSQEQREKTRASMLATMQKKRGGIIP